MSDNDQALQRISKINLKLGSLEIDFEGTEEYIRNDLPSLLGLMCEYFTLERNSANSETSFEEAEELLATPDPTNQRVQMTTNAIAARLDVKTGSDLVLAACAHLCLVKGAETFERKNILAEMQTASNYYSQTHSKNLSSSLLSLAKANKLIERSKDNYALTAKTKSELEVALA